MKMSKSTLKKTGEETAYISNTRLDEFIELFKKHFGRHLSRKEALEKGMKLVRLMELTYNPISKREFTRLLVRRFILDEDARKHMRLKGILNNAIMKSYDYKCNEN